MKNYLLLQQNVAYPYNQQFLHDLSQFHQKERELRGQDQISSYDLNECMDQEFISYYYVMKDLQK